MYGRGNAFGATSRPDYNNVAPPENLNKRQGYANMNQVGDQTSEQQQSSYGRKRTAKLDDDYFEDDDEEVSDVPNSGQVVADDDDEEDDPLDAFMASIEKEVKKTTVAKQLKPVVVVQAESMASKGKPKENKGLRTDIEEEDAEESYYKYMGKLDRWYTLISIEVMC